jgi:hypothetical protein
MVEGPSQYKARGQTWLSPRPSALILECPPPTDPPTLGGKAAEQRVIRARVN